VIIAIWIASVIASLWANIYEEIMKILASRYKILATSTTAPTSSDPSMSFPGRTSTVVNDRIFPVYGVRNIRSGLPIWIAFLSIFSILYIVLAIFVSPSMIKTLWYKIKEWLNSIDTDFAIYNPLFVLDYLGSPNESDRL
jgi:hypothetical protein